MAWWDHEELKSPEHRSDNYKLAFPDEYTAQEVQDARDRVNGVKKSNQNIECHSGGAKGSDLIFGACARVCQHKVIHHSFDSHNTYCDPNERLNHTETELLNATQMVMNAAQHMKRNLPDHYKRRLLLRNALLVKDVQCVYAVGIKKSDNVIAGGTAWGVYMAQLNDTPVFFYDQDINLWHYCQLDTSSIKGSQMHYSTLNEETVPIPGYSYSKYACIGTRNINDGGIYGIRNLFGRTLQKQIEISNEKS